MFCIVFYLTDFRAPCMEDADCVHGLKQDNLSKDYSGKLIALWIWA
jgi:hypothetical protein